MWIKNKLYALYHPEQYHGWGQKKKYFEGWYYKVVNADQSEAYAIIPGIAMDEIGQKQAFIQILDGHRHTAEYYKFDADAFNPDPSSFDVQIDSNRFTEKGLQFNLKEISGELHFQNNVPWPVTTFSPGIMGPYAFAPFMECYHGIVSMDHSITGDLIIGNKKVDFNGGRGYMEKDWGHSFPSAYVWMQSNHFSEPGISLKLSVAKIPWLTGSFVGFIAGIWLKDRLIRFTTYNSSELLKNEIGDKLVTIWMENKKYRLEVIAKREDSTSLASPIQGMMDGRINESLNSSVEIKLLEKNSGDVLFDGIGTSAGIEVAGKVEEIVC